MKRPTPWLRISCIFGSLCLVITNLTGCASNRVKHATSAVQTAPVAYGTITHIRSANTSYNKALCEKADRPAGSGAACANLEDYNEARLVYLHSSRVIYQWFFVPKGWNAEQNSILEVNPANSVTATRLAAQKPHKGCEWTGYSLHDLTSGTGMVKGFALGMLIVPAVVIAADETIHQGGVECDGWSYKVLLEES